MCLRTQPRVKANFPPPSSEFDAPNCALRRRRVSLRACKQIAKWSVLWPELAALILTMASQAVHYLRQKYAARVRPVSRAEPETRRPASAAVQNTSVWPLRASPPVPQSRLTDRNMRPAVPQVHALPPCACAASHRHADSCMRWDAFAMDYACALFICCPCAALRCAALRCSA